MVALMLGVPGTRQKGLRPMARYTRRHSVLAPTALALIAGTALSFVAQGQSWNGGNGNWFTATNWTPNTAPNAAGAAVTIGAAGTYTVTLDASTTIGTLNLSNASASLLIPSGNSLNVGGAINNAGTIRINNGGGSTTSIALNTNISFSGTGRVILAANPANIDTARFVLNVGGAGVTNNAGHTISGIGQFNNIGLTNAGLVDADSPAGPLQFTFNGHTNTGTMRSSTGTLNFSSTSVNNAGGTISAIGTGITNFSSTTITGGTVTTSGSGQLLVSSARFTGVTNTGTTTVVNGATLFIDGTGITNNGTILVNPAAGGSTTSIGIGDGDRTISGSGTVVLNANQGNIDTARFYREGANSSVTIGANQTVRGTGQFNDIGVTNNGTIGANVSGTTLQMIFRGTNNNGLMAATNGGNLQFNGGYVVNNSASGQVVADGTNSTVSLISSTINGGSVIGQNGGVVQVPPGNSGSFGALTQSGPFTVGAGATLFLNAATGTTINGTVTVNPSAAGQTTSIGVNVDGNATLGGNGTIVLNANDANIDTARFFRLASNNSALTLGSGLTVRGQGQFNDIGVTNNGTIQADLAGKTIQMIFRGTTNNGTLKAINGGNLQFNGGYVVTNVGAGSISAIGAGSTVSLLNTTINGGTIGATGGGLVQIPPGNSAYFGALTQSGAMTVFPGSGLYCNASTGTTINGTITVNPSASGQTTSIGSNFDGNVTLGGNGTIVLNANDSNIDTARFFRALSNNSAFTFGSGLTVRGQGQFTDIGITNNGTIQADLAGKTIQMIFRGATNNGTLKAINGGNLQLNGSYALTNVGSGQIFADGAGSTVTLLGSSSISGGTVSGTNGGLVQVAGNNSAFFGALTQSGAMSVQTGGSLFCNTTTGLTINGTLTINPSASGATTSFGSNTNANNVIGGNGTIVFNANTSNLDTARLYRAAGTNDAFTFGPNLTLRGNGQFNDIATTIQGTLSPGDATNTGTISSVFRALSFAGTSRYNARIGKSGTNLFNDTISSNSTVNLAGNCTVSFSGAYTPVSGEGWNIITCASRVGKFNTINIPVIALPKVLKLTYLPTGVRVSVACNSADITGLGGSGGPDGNLTSDDVVAFLAGFFASDLAVADVASLGGNLVPDGQLTADDIVAFLAAFFRGCQ
jgi:hypothetical protein